MILIVQIIKHKITTQIIKVLGLILEFPSGQILLEIIRHEYDIEASRKEILKPRIGLLLQFITIFLLASCVIKTASVEISFFNDVDECIILTNMKELSNC